MTHDQALATLHRAARRKLAHLTLVVALGAVGFGASQIPRDIERGLDLSTAVGGAALGALVWGLPMWLFFRYIFMGEQRRILRVQDLIPAGVVELHDRRILTVRTQEGADLVLPMMKRVDRLELGQGVWLTEPAELGATVTAVAAVDSDAGKGIVLWPRGQAAESTRWL